MVHPYREAGEQDICIIAYISRVCTATLRNKEERIRRSFYMAIETSTKAFAFAMRNPTDHTCS